MGSNKPAILMDDFISLLALPGNAKVDIFYTGQAIFAAAVSHTAPEQDMCFLGVLLKSSTLPYANKDVDQLMLDLNKDFGSYENISFNHIYANKGVIKTTSKLH